MASGPITLWEIDGETVETVADFILGGSKITADGYEEMWRNPKCISLNERRQSEKSTNPTIPTL